MGINASYRLCFVMVTVKSCWLIPAGLQMLYHIAQNGGGGNIGDFGETYVIRQYFTQLNYRCNELAIG